MLERSILECPGQELRPQAVLELHQLGIEWPTGGQELPRLRLQALPPLDELGFFRPYPDNALRHELTCGLKLR